MYSVHYILYTVYCTLYTVYCTLYTVHCTLYTVYCILYTVYCILYTVYYTLHCTLYTVHYILYTVHCILCISIYISMTIWTLFKHHYCTFITYSTDVISNLTEGTHCTFLGCYCLICTTVPRRTGFTPSRPLCRRIVSWLTCLRELGRLVYHAWEGQKFPKVTGLLGVAVTRMRGNKG